ncbi:MAG: hypothetical protein CSA21_00600 [Deltaproteobacteria bacterium]|nr:MAG: hypothetical protein CSA21_00600 [Deltaproteobacteria bacterium]
MSTRQNKNERIYCAWANVESTCHRHFYRIQKIVKTVSGYIDFHRDEMSGFVKYTFVFKHVKIRRHDVDKLDHQGIPYYWDYGMHANHVNEGCVIKGRHREDSFMMQQEFQVGEVILQGKLFSFLIRDSCSSACRGVAPGLDIHTRIRRGETSIEKTFKAPPHSAEGMLRFGTSFRVLVREC